MREIWIGLILTAMLAAALALTRDWWLPLQARETWHASWLESRPAPESGAAALRAEHERLLAQLEKQYGEKIALEKEKNRRYRSELERLREEKQSP